MRAGCWRKRGCSSSRRQPRRSLSLRKLVAEQPEIRDETIVCVLTSSALKWLDDYGEASAKGGVETRTVGTALTAVDRHISSS